MYAAIWRALPGGRGLKTLQAFVLFLAVVAVLFLWVFPAVAPLLPFDREVTVESMGAGLRDLDASGSTS